MNRENPATHGQPESITNRFKNLFVSTVPTVLSVMSLVLSTVLTVLVYLAPGSLNIYQPTSFCVIRGYSMIGFPSDYLALPFTLENTGRGAKTIEEPTLVLKEKTSGRTVIYTIAGVLPDLNRSSRNQLYEEAFSVTVPAYTTQRSIMVFHTQQWWDQTTTDHDFHFMSGERWDAKLVYLNTEGVNTTWNDNKPIVTLPIYGSVDNLKYNTESNNDCYALRTVDLTSVENSSK